jgi:hypothetical protein
MLGIGSPFGGGCRLQPLEEAHDLSPGVPGLKIRTISGSCRVGNDKTSTL